ncbi:Geranylgeranyl reductase [Candidatus Promineifilum breve]|uniref:Geranylgeranyl reductase n=1 Tax=Candidatus Promineifilum breve TaxID=1806508 RepID=A0A160T0V0_9CHLR|nr:NAD(P)/FAD-dependent oxidoreductase [Candidatus Promineifilum breve]CUS03124.2 Geranylgeranyl reductase [Candidatus Promineifilum breve]
MQTVSEHDVIVVGAGPGGATTATALAQRGHDVLLIDRHTFPRDKVCGDAISQGCIQIMNDLGMAGKVKAAVARGEFHRLDGMRLVGPSGHVLHSEFQHGAGGVESYVSPRVYFDALIQQQAVESGAGFLQAEVKEPLLEDGRVAGVVARANGEWQAYRSRVVVGADGVTSTIMRHLRPEGGQHSDKHRAVALRAYIEGMEIYPHEVEFFLYDEILPGYAWIFPAGDHVANIGLGMRLDKFRGLKRNLKKMLQDFLAMPDLRARLPNSHALRDVAVWQLNFGSQKHLRHAYDGALLVGDAAGLINPLTGGGIHNALISGCLAAETIDEALRVNNTTREGLAIYEQRCDEAMGPEMRKSFLYQRVLLNYPRVVDFLIRYMGRHGGVAQSFLSKL